MSPLPRQASGHGFTLPGLLMTIGIVAVLLAIGTPALRELALEARLTAAANELVHAAHLARQLAASRGTTVVLCPADGSGRCGPGHAWSRGWLLYVNEDLDEPPHQDLGEPTLLASQGPPAGSLSANRPSFAFRPAGRRSTNGRLVLCDERGPARARTIFISYTGRPRVVRGDISGNDLNC